MADVLREKLSRNEFVITVEIDPPKGASPWGVYDRMRPLANMVDAVNIADSPMARMRMSPIALAHLVQEELKLEAVFHLTCRDRNIIGLQSELLGAYALGVNNILSLTGDDPKVGDHPRAKGVFDVDSTGLIRMAGKLNKGYDMMDNELDCRTDFFIGAVANPGAEDLDKEMERIKAKVDAGVMFFQTQPVFDLSRLERFLDISSSIPVPMIYGLLPLKSAKLAHYLNNNVPGVHVPDRFVDMLQAKGRNAGIEIARELYTEMKKTVPGIHIFPMGDISMVETILKGEGEYAKCS
ncbi:MAG: 5,10-methylenetetrahydrofolate reductase [Firmicutes bacterium]|nr:5,10-methylenetetrahydrofolate reductase [Bacillota bacterium]MDI6706340.1 methylenetetrahydrofolate reductase [Bacillota bacterium]